MQSVISQHLIESRIWFLQLFARLPALAFARYLSFFQMSISLNMNMTCVYCLFRERKISLHFM